MYQLNNNEEKLCQQIKDAAVHKILEPGLLEQIYVVCLCHELTK